MPLVDLRVWNTTIKAKRSQHPVTGGRSFAIWNAPNRETHAPIKPAPTSTMGAAMLCCVWLGARRRRWVGCIRSGWVERRAPTPAPALRNRGRVASMFLCKRGVEGRAPQNWLGVRVYGVR